MDNRPVRHSVPLAVFLAIVLAIVALAPALFGHFFKTDTHVRQIKKQSVASFSGWLGLFWEPTEELPFMVGDECCVWDRNVCAPFWPMPPFREVCDGRLVAKVFPDVGQQSQWYYVCRDTTQEVIEHYLITQNKYQSVDGIGVRCSGWPEDSAWEKVACHDLVSKGSEITVYGGLW